MPASVLPLLKAEREYECPFTVCTEAEHLTMPAAEQLAGEPPFWPGHVHETEFPAAERPATRGSESLPKDRTYRNRKRMPRKRTPCSPYRRPGTEEVPFDTAPSTSAPVEEDDFGSFTSPDTDPDEVG